MQLRFLLASCVVACGAMALDCKSKPSGEESKARIVAGPPPALGEPAAGMEDEEEGGAGARAAGEEGKIGRRNSDDVDRMAGVRGPADMAQLQAFGAISYLGEEKDDAKSRGYPASPSASSLSGHGYGSGNCVGYGRGGGGTAPPSRGRRGLGRGARRR